MAALQPGLHTLEVLHRRYFLPVPFHSVIVQELFEPQIILDYVPKGPLSQIVPKPQRLTSRCCLVYLEVHRSDSAKFPLYLQVAKK